jgi:alpha-tubulin suppressor-like RCC1 family protein
MKTSLILSVFALTACGWAANAPSAPDAFAGETLTAVTVIPYFDRICGAREDATVECVDAPATIADPYPILAPLGDKVVQLPSPASRLAAGGNAVCALLGDASVWCWADNWEANSPVEIGTSVTHMSISVDGLVCLLGASGGVTCLGNYGQPFQADLLPGVGAVALGGHRAVSLALGEGSLIVALDDGTVLTWNTSTASLSVPGTPVIGVSNAVALTAASAFSGGSGEHACALLADKTVVCWGQNDNGELGTGSASAPSAVALGVVGVRGATQVTAGAEHTCARLEDGAVVCWGASGEFAGTTNPKTGDFFSPVPMSVSHVTGAVDLQAGEVVNCALDAHGAVTCWGGDHHR